MRFLYFIILFTFFACHSENDSNPLYYNNPEELKEALIDANKIAAEK